MLWFSVWCWASDNSTFCYLQQVVFYVTEIPAIKKNHAYKVKLANHHLELISSLPGTSQEPSSSWCPPDVSNYSSRVAWVFMGTCSVQHIWRAHAWQNHGVCAEAGVISARLLCHQFPHRKNETMDPSMVEGILTCSICWSMIVTKYPCICNHFKIHFLQQRSQLNERDGWQRVTASQPAKKSSRDDSWKMSKISKSSGWVFPCLHLSKVLSNRKECLLEMLV